MVDFSLAMSVFFRNMLFRKGLRGDGWATAEYYGAKGDVNVNDKVAFEDALADLETTRGRLVLGPKTYRIDGLLAMPPSVSIAGIPDATYIAWNHATSNGLTFGDPPNDGPPLVVSDVRFIGLIAKSGSSVVVGSGARVQFVRCAWNGVDSTGAPSNNLQGKLLNQTVLASSRTEFIDCDLNVASPDDPGLDVSTGLVRVVRGRIAMPASYTSNLVEVGNGGRALLRDVDIDLSAYGGGGPARAVYASNAGAELDIADCLLKNGAIVTGLTGIQWVAGTPVNITNLRRSGTIALTLFGNDAAALGSRIDLPPTLALTFGSVATIDLTGLHYRAFVVRCSATSGPAITLPSGLYPGQELLFTYVNLAGNTVAPSFATTPVTGNASMDVGTGNTLTSVFVWESRDASSAYRWVQKGGWGVGTTLV